MCSRISYTSFFRVPAHTWPLVYTCHTSMIIIFHIQTLNGHRVSAFLLSVYFVGAIENYSRSPIFLFCLETVRFSHTHTLCTLKANPCSYSHRWWWWFGVLAGVLVDFASCFVSVGKHGRVWFAAAMACGSWFVLSFRFASHYRCAKSPIFHRLWCDVAHPPGK